MAAERDRDDGDDPVADGGDPVCWLDRLCPDCGAMPTPDPPVEGRCWRCGAAAES